MEEISRPKILFIINPNAGKQNSQVFLTELETYRSQVDIRLSEYPGHSFEIAKEELENYETFVAAGGDGTINEVASAIYGTGKNLAVLPIGSGNGFAREFGFTQNIGKLMAAIRQNKVTPTDVIQLNNRISIHIAGVGFDSAVCLQFGKLKKHGFLNYAGSILQVIKSYQPIEATIKTKNETITGRFFMINLVNTGQFGYNVPILPAANPSDGSFEMVLVSPFSKWFFTFFSLRMLAGKLKSSKYVRIISCTSEVSLSTSQNIFQLEGEPVEIESPVQIKMLHGKLNVIGAHQA